MEIVTEKRTYEERTNLFSLLHISIENINDIIIIIIINHSLMKYISGIDKAHKKTSNI